MSALFQQKHITINLIKSDLEQDFSRQTECNLFYYYVSFLNISFIKKNRYIYALRAGEAASRSYNN